jgi:uncharacterized protein (TIGR00369 family)
LDGKDDGVIEARDPDYRSAVQRIIDAAPFIQDVGVRLVEVGPGWCEMELPVRPAHEQQDGHVHAGVLMTLADHTAGSAGTTLVAAHEYVLTAELNISFLRAARGEILRCRSEVIKPGRRLIVAESSVRACTGDQSELVAKARITLAVLERRNVPGAP